jgi:hypothetical protein
MRYVSDITVKENITNEKFSISTSVKRAKKTEKEGVDD